MNSNGPVRELTFEDRAKWGICPTCQAQHGEWCHAEVGMQLGVNVNGSRLQTGQGAHLSRLKQAPFNVREVPA